MFTRRSLHSYDRYLGTPYDGLQTRSNVSIHALHWRHHVSRLEKRRTFDKHRTLCVPRQVVIPPFPFLREARAKVVVVETDLNQREIWDCCWEVFKWNVYMHTWIKSTIFRDLCLAHSKRFLDLANSVFCPGGQLFRHLYMSLLAKT